MKKIIFAMSFIAYAAQADLVKADFSKHCQVSNGWELNLDYYWDGHPMGPGGWSAVAQINKWGKFTLNVTDQFIWQTVGIWNGQNRLDTINVDLSLNNKTFKFREQMPVGYSNWESFTMECN